MKALIFQLDGKIPNIALMRIAAHHRERGDEVEFRWTGSPRRELWDNPDLVYGSAIFEKTRGAVAQLTSEFPAAVDTNHLNESLAYATQVMHSSWSMNNEAQALTIDEIHAHLKAGHEAALVTYVRVTVFDHRHVDYIRADGTGFRLGWPGRRSVYAFANQIRLVPPCMTLKSRRKKACITC